MTSDLSKTPFIKTAQQMNKDVGILDKRISLLTDELITMIKNNATISADYEASIFRPKNDLGMLLFKKGRKSPSEYTINLLTLKPTMNSIIKIGLSDDIITMLTF